jgi:hypothetical protein
MRWSGRLLLLGLIVLQSPALVWGQTSLALPASSEPPPPPSYRVLWPEAATPGKREVTQELVGVSSPMIPDPDRYPRPVEAILSPRQILFDSKFDATWLPGSGQNGLAIVDVELTTTLKIDSILAPITITPYAAAHAWHGPSTVGLPTELYDLNAEIGWRPRLAEWLFVDVAATPGLYTDFKRVAGNSFMMRGRVVGIVAFSERLQIAAGAMYVNRNLTKVLPAGGVIWNPSEETRLFLVFPQPKVSHRVLSVGDTQMWAFLAGEFGGGRWQAESTRGENDSIDYTDWRLILGVESVYRERWRGHVDVGYVFNRRVNFASTDSDFRPSNTVMLRAGLRY